MELREADATDAAVLAALWRMAVDARRDELALPRLFERDEDYARLVAHRLADPRSFAVLLEDAAACVAMALAMQALADDGASDVAVPGLVHVSMVAVHPRRWGERLADRVLTRLLENARARGFDRAQLWTHETNARGQRLYERLGWVDSGRRSVDDHGEAIRHYERRLTRDLGSNRDRGTPRPGRVTLEW